VAQDASIEDFTLVFAVGGAADEFFNKYLASYVDTSVRPWRYKDPNTANAMVGAEGAAAGAAPAPATTGPTLLGELLKLLAQSGPNLDAFYRAQQIRDLFFRDAGGKKFAWKMDLRVLELEPGITDLVIDIDGQGQRYVHGPVQAFRSTGRDRAGGDGGDHRQSAHLGSDLDLSGQRPLGAFSAARKGPHREHRDAGAPERRIRVRRPQGADRHQFRQPAQPAQQRCAQGLPLPRQGGLSHVGQLIVSLAHAACHLGQAAGSRGLRAQRHAPWRAGSMDAWLDEQSRSAGVDASARAVAVPAAFVLPPGRWRLRVGASCWV
jgi:hypothetical protein